MSLPAIILKKESLANFEESIEKEWIITNGLGGYASSTVLGLNTRKYHGMLVAAINPPRDRRLCVAKFDEELILEGNAYPLFSNEFKDGIRPKGYVFLEEFSLSPLPRYVYSVGNVRVQKTIFMPHGKNVVVALYQVSGGDSSDAFMRVYPIISFRHFHSVIDRCLGVFGFVQKPLDGKVLVNVEGSPSALVLWSTDGAYVQSEKWIERVYFREEFSRGESHLDDWFAPGFFELNLRGGCGKFAIAALASRNVDEAISIADDMPSSIGDVERLYRSVLDKRKRLLEDFYAGHGGICAEEWLNWLVLAADMFVVETSGDGLRSIVAGYHWFEDWGRDAFVSLPGLMLVTGRFEDARKVFLAFKKYSLNGLIPNFVSDQFAKPLYNAVDATLWYINAILQYVKYTGDFEFVRRFLWEDLKDSVEFFKAGTAFGIKVDDDGLLAHGPQLTWMDAAVHGQPVTPRAGKAVEVEALWYNALKTLEVLAKHFNEQAEAERFREMAEKAMKSFLRKFWNPEESCLLDVADSSGLEGYSIRPNQIIAVSLDFTMLGRDKSAKVVNLVRDRLLAPYGLRSLARDDPSYVGTYSGDRQTRDRAYHNGTVWPWLLGPFTTAFMKVYGYSETMRHYAFENFLLPIFRDQFYRAGLGSISEIFDGDPPHKPRGCIAQAWSVAELLRAYVEDVLFIRPKHEMDVMGFKPQSY